MRRRRRNHATPPARATRGKLISGADQLLPHKPKHYRPDIDGLRAIAVLAVLAFHGEIALFAAGFAGVDVFFVISGFLITGIILDALEKGTFSFREFYTRRANRILPALLIVLLVTMIVGWLVFYPWELRALGHNVVASALFVSNFQLWTEAGYFDAWLKPLRHLWSLAVEEQFYLLWPIAAVAMYKRRIGFTWPLIIVIVLSFAFAQLALHSYYATAAFYFPIARFWEIGLGALLAVHVDRSKESESSTPVREIAALAGSLLIALTFFFVNRKTLWPGPWALPPVVGTAILIWAGPSTRINKLLGNKLLVAIGLISYPLYLWHWPVNVLVRLVIETQLPRTQRVGLMLFSILLAFLTYRYIEIPIRFGAHKRRSAIVLVSALAITGLFGFSFATDVQPRLGGALAALADSARFDWTSPSGGFVGATQKLKINTLDGDSTRTIMMIGDSHMEQYWPRFAELHRINPSGPRVEFVTYGGCPMLPGTNRIDLDSKGSHFRCPEFFVKAMEKALDPSVKTVVFAGNWQNYLVRDDIVLVATNTQLRITGPATDSAFAMLDRYVKTLRSHGKRVVLILSSPVSPWFRPDSILPHRRLPWLPPAPRIDSVPRKTIEDKNVFITRRLLRIASETGAEVIDPVNYFCSVTNCPVKQPNGEPIYRDDNHLRATVVRKVTFLDTIVTR